MKSGDCPGGYEAYDLLTLRINQLDVKCVDLSAFLGDGHVGVW